MTRLLTERAACEYLSVSRPFLAKGRAEGERAGHAPTPPFIKAGRMIRYEIQALDAWIEEHRQGTGA